jgi:hypothetical protein
MSSFTRGFRDELVKIGFGPEVRRTLLNAQAAVARRLVGVDPRLPVPFAESQLEDAVSKMRLQQRLVELNRMAMGLDPEPATFGEKTAMFRYMTPRTARRILLNSGYDDRDPGFRSMAHQVTGEGDLNQMTQFQLKTLLSIMMGKAI